MIETLTNQVSIPVCLSLSACVITVLSSELNAQNPPSFVMPSGNIYCALIGKDNNMLRCEIQSMLNPLPPQPYPNYCQFDWGAGFLLPQQGKPEVLCISDTIAGTNNILSYGKNWQHSGFKCISQRTGLMCSNPGGHGFFLSRQQWKAF
jgi:hypothetical protein